MQPYLDSNNPTIFGFTINGVIRSDPNECQYGANFKSQNIPDSGTSQTLSLQAVGKIARLLLISHLQSDYLVSWAFVI